MVDLPRDSIYMWMYVQGLKHVNLAEIEAACAAAGKEIRQKDYDNYWNGYHRSTLYNGKDEYDVFSLHRQMQKHSPKLDFFDKKLEDYPLNPMLDLPPVENRWIPCSASNKPMIKWSQGCKTLAEAKMYANQVYLAENLVGTDHIVIDCDGDHGDGLDYDAIDFLWQFADRTHCLMKPKAIREYPGGRDSDNPASFHLTFKTDRVIPRMIWSDCAGMDILGNENNNIRYLKDKRWNGLQPAMLTSEVWEAIKLYVRRRYEG